MTYPARKNLLLLPFLTLMILFLLASKEVGAGVQAGLRLSYLAIIPSVFPFCIFSSYFTSIEPPRKPGCISRTFTRVFHLPPQAAVTFLIGLLCGFPLGAKATADGYRAGIYTKRQAERMLCFCNNTSLSFLLSGVGGAMRGSLRDGIALFCVQTLLALCLAVLTGVSDRKKSIDLQIPPSHPTSTPFSFPKAVTDAVSSTLTVCGFVVFFSALLSMLSSCLPTAAYLSVAAFLEVGSACAAAAAVPHGLVISAFAVCFSGFSVHMQAAAMLQGTDLSMKQYFLAKLFSGVAGAALIYLYTQFPS